MTAVLFIREGTQKGCIGIFHTIRLLYVSFLSEHHFLPILDEPICHLPAEVMIGVVWKFLIVSQAYSQALLYTSVEAVPHTTDLKSE